MKPFQTKTCQRFEECLFDLPQLFWWLFEASQKSIGSILIQIDVNFESEAHFFRDFSRLSLHLKFIIRDGTDQKLINYYFGLDSCSVMAVFWRFRPISCAISTNLGWNCRQGAIDAHCVFWYLNNNNSPIKYLSI